MFIWEMGNGNFYYTVAISFFFSFFVIWKYFIEEQAIKHKEMIAVCH